MNFYNSNPFEMMMNMGKQNNNPMNQMMNFNSNPPPIDRQKLTQAVSQFSEDNYAKLVAQARDKGISDEDIQKGLDFLLKMR